MAAFLKTKGCGKLLIFLETLGVNLSNIKLPTVSSANFEGFSVTQQNREEKNEEKNTGKDESISEEFNQKKMRLIAAFLIQKKTENSLSKIVNASRKIREEIILDRKAQESTHNDPEESQCDTSPIQSHSSLNELTQEIDVSQSEVKNPMSKSSSNIDIEAKDLNESALILSDFDVEELITDEDEGTEIGWLSIGSLSIANIEPEKIDLNSNLNKGQSAAPVICQARNSHEGSGSREHYTLVAELEAIADGEYEKWKSLRKKRISRLDRVESDDTYDLFFSLDEEKPKNRTDNFFNEEEDIYETSFLDRVASNLNPTLFRFYCRVVPNDMIISLVCSLMLPLNCDLYI